MLTFTKGELSCERCGEGFSTAVFACLPNGCKQVFSSDRTDSTSSFYDFVFCKSAASPLVLSSEFPAELSDLQGAAFSVAASFVPGFFCSCSGDNVISSIISAAEKTAHFSISEGLVPRPVSRPGKKKRFSGCSPGTFRSAGSSSQIRRSMRL